MSGVTERELDPEDTKLLTLARAARLRAFAPHTGHLAGAAVRDADGRTYAAGTVEHPQPALTTSALRGALAAAFSSGSRRLEACALVSDPAELDETDAALLAGLAPGVPLLLAGPDAVPVARLTGGAGRAGG